MAEAVVYSSIQTEAESLILKCLKKHFGNQKGYNPTACATWISQCNEEMLNTMLKLCRNFKYLFSTQVMQK
jgi:hypothetical protein